MSRHETIRTWIAVLLIPQFIVCLTGAINAQARDVLITFDRGADWQGLSLPSRKEDKGLTVYAHLARRAAVSQSAVRAYLRANDIPYRPFVVSNVIHAQLPVSHLPSVARLAGVARIVENTPFEQEDVFMEPDKITPRSAAPEWGISHIRADAVWELGFTGQGVVIGGTDTGFEWTHPAIRASYRGTMGDTADHAYNWHDAIHEISPLHNDSIVDPSNNPCGLDSPIPCDDHGHGTHTMGTMTGLDGGNQTGVAPGAQWIACRNMERGWGSPATYLECLEWFLAPTDGNGENPDPTKAPHVINNSWACPEIEGCNPDNFDILRDAVENLRAAGIVVVVSAGNSGSSCSSVSAPLAIFEGSFTVGAINNQDTIAGFSSRGPVDVDGSGRTKPDVSAPGVNVRSAWRNGSYRNASGTSMAGPHVAGVVALIISANPTLAGQVEVIESIIETTARRKTTEQDCGGISGKDALNNTYGHGVVDAVAAVEMAMMISSTHQVPDANRITTIRVHPNPARGSFFISSDILHTAGSMRIYASDGRIVYTTHNRSLPAMIDVPGLPEGLYVVQVDGAQPIRIMIVRG